MHYVAWIGIVMLLIGGFAPMVSQTLLAQRLQRAHQMDLTAIILAAPNCLFHDPLNEENTKAAQPHTLSQYSPQAHENHDDGKKGHESQEACGYCNLYAHSPFLLTTQLQITLTIAARHAFIAAMGAAFRPYTVAAASRPQPPPL
ncbi:DUF2946 family protein [Glaciimonas sp. GG7]